MFQGEDELCRHGCVCTVTAFLNHGVSEAVEKVGEFETVGGAVASMRKP
jgi:hypothetical protein